MACGPKADTGRGGHGMRQAAAAARPTQSCTAAAGVPSLAAAALTTNLRSLTRRRGSVHTHQPPLFTAATGKTASGATPTCSRPPSPFHCPRQWRPRPRVGRGAPNAAAWLNGWSCSHAVTSSRVLTPPAASPAATTGARNDASATTVATPPCARPHWGRWGCWWGGGWDW